jgi:hypothetical protein
VTLSDVTARLIQIHREYQQAGGHQDADTISVATRPLADLLGFESDFIPEIVRRLARDLGIPLAPGTRVRNIYVDKARKLSLDEIARRFVERYAPTEVPV